MLHSLLHRIIYFKLTLHLFFCLLLFSYSFSQQPSFHQIGKEAGLPSDNIYDILFDRENFLWVATDKGVSRFDGISFENFTQSDGLPDNEIFSLFEDSQGRIWFGSYNGAPGYWKSGLFYNRGNLSSLKSIQKTNYISSIAEDALGNIYLASRDGKVHFVPLNGDALFLFEELPSSMASIGIKSKGKVDFATSTCEILSYQNGNITYHSLEPEMHPSSFKRSEIMVSTVLQNGSFLYCYGSKVALIDSSYIRINYPKTKVDDESNIHVVKQIPNDGIYLCTSKGAYLYRTLDFGADYDSRYLPDLHISNVAKDREGGLWFASNKGLWYAPVPEIRIQKSLSSQESVSITAVEATDSKEIILGFKNSGLALLPFLGADTCFQITGSVNHSIHFNQIMPIDQNRYWVGTETYLGLLDKENQRLLTPLIGRTIDLSRNAKEKKVCLCHTFGWDEFQEDSLINSTLQGRQTVNANQTKSTRCHSVWYDWAGGLWISSNSQLLRIQNSDTTFFSELGNFRITEIYGDNRQNLFFGTDGKGIIWANGKTLKVIGAGTAFSKSNIKKIQNLDDNTLGIASDHGFYALHYIDIESSFAISAPLGFLDGLPSDDINDFALVNDTLLLATESGLSLVPYWMVATRTLKPKVRIQSLSYGPDGKPIGNDSILPYHHEGLSIFFAGECFRSQGKFTYRYRIRGLDESWHTTSSSFVEIPYLDHGDYTFEVQAMNHQGNWTSIPAKINFRISTPFWKALWFMLLVPFLILTILLISFQRILEEANARHRLRTKLFDAEQRALIGQMNPHFIFNSLNSIQSYYMVENKTKANEFLADFGDLIRSILNNSRSSTISISDEIAELTLYLRLESLRLKDRFEYFFEVDPMLLEADCRIPTMLLQPFIENSIWHGITPLTDRKGLISISFEMKNDYLHCTIIDNGVGRAKSKALKKAKPQKHKSVAMSIANERVELINDFLNEEISLIVEDLYGPNSLACGTKVVLEIPVYLLASIEK